VEFLLTLNVEKKDFNVMQSLLNKNSTRIFEDQISVEFENTHSLLEIIRLLDANNISIKNLSVKTPTLEDAYLALTTSIQTEKK
jgi:hypothetical protein